MVKRAARHVIRADGAPRDWLTAVKTAIADSGNDDIGLALALVGGVALVAYAARHGGAHEIIGCSVFATTLVAGTPRRPCRTSSSSPAPGGFFACSTRGASTC